MPVPAPHPDARAVVTGASQGIGEALAFDLAGRGHHLIVTARRGDVLTELAERITARHGVTVEVRAVDLADPTAREVFCQELAGRNISILCANAGTATFGPLAKLDPAGEKAQVQLNAIAVHDLCLAVLPGMLERQAGGILISGSAAGNSPIPNNATYAATKAFANTFSESLRGEVKKQGVNVTLLAPGPVRTEFLETAGMDERTFAAAFPKFLWIPSRDVAKKGIEALESGRSVIPGWQNEIPARVFEFLPRKLLLPLIKNQHPALRQSR